MPAHDRAFKEWDVVCRALKSGRQTVLIRKGGIREEDGIFRVTDSQFFLLPTFEHQDPNLLRPPFTLEPEDARIDPRSFRIDAYSQVDTVFEAAEEERLAEIQDEHIWNERYIRMRLDFNPYDPLFVLLLRVYRLPRAVTLPMRPEYEGCKSWVSLDCPLSTAGAVPVLSDEEFARRRGKIRSILPPTRNPNAAPADSV